MGTGHLVLPCDQQQLLVAEQRLPARRAASRRQRRRMRLPRLRRSDGVRESGGHHGAGERHRVHERAVADLLQLRPLQLRGRWAHVLGIRQRHAAPPAGDVPREQRLRHDGRLHARARPGRAGLRLQRSRGSGDQRGLTAAVRMERHPHPLLVQPGRHPGSAGAERDRAGEPRPPRGHRGVIHHPRRRRHGDRPHMPDSINTDMLKTFQSWSSF